MKYKTFLRYFAINLLIAVIYSAIIDYIFIVEKDYNPIGAGLRFWYCVLVHFFSILGIAATVPKSQESKFLLYNVASFIIIVFLLLQFDSYVFSGWVDYLKSKYHY